MRVFTYVFIISGVMALLYAGGFHDLPTGDFISFLLTDGLGGLKETTLYTKMTTILALTALAGGIVATLFGRSPDVVLLKASFVSFFLGAFLIDLIWFYNKLFSYGTWYAIIASIILVPITYGFIISAWDWWTGTD